MRTTVTKLFWAWDFDKEEKWLNAMAAKGLALVSVAFGRYVFEPCTPGEYTVRLELLDNVPSHAESRSYIQFVEDTGATCVGTLFRWVYFRKKTTTDSFDLYSDSTCRMQHLNRILTLLGAVLLLQGSSILCNFSVWLNAGMHSPFRWVYYGFLAFIVVFNICLIWGMLRIVRKKQALKKEQTLYE